MPFAAARRRESQSQSEFHALESDLAVASDKSISSRIRDARPKGKLLAQLHDPKLTDRVRCEIAALYMQRAFRGHRVRKEYAHNHHKINLRYEIKILQERSQRRGLFVGFLQHIGYMVLLELLDRRSVRTASSLTMARSAWHSKDAKNSR